MVQEDRLLRALFGENEVDEFEKKCLTVPGYEALWRLSSYLPKEDKADTKADFNYIQSILIYNHKYMRLLEIYAKRVLKLREVKAPEIIQNHEYRKFFEKVVDLFGFKLTDDEVKELHKPIPEELREEFHDELVEETKNQ